MHFQVKDLKFLVKCRSQKLISPLNHFGSSRAPRITSELLHVAYETPHGLPSPTPAGPRQPAGSLCPSSVEFIASSLSRPSSLAAKHLSPCLSGMLLFIFKRSSNSALRLM